MRENGVLTWIITDQLGSTTALANEDGTLKTLLRYTAFGEIRKAYGSDQATDYRYTGQRSESEIGLYFYVSRFYDPALGRFIQPDSIIPDPGSAKGYDRYAYVNNNPINFNDPSGHRECNEEDCLDTMRNGTGVNYIPTTIYSLLNGGYEDTQDILRAYMSAHPEYDPIRDATVMNDRPLQGELARAKMQVEVENSPTFDERITQIIDKPEFEPILANQYTSVVAGAVSVLATDAMFVSMATLHDPVTVGITYGIARASGLIGLFATGYQYQHNLYGTTKADAEIAAATTITGSIPKPDMAWTVHAGFIYTTLRTFGAIDSPW